jgi:predicted nucleotide-binding protein
LREVVEAFTKLAIKANVEWEVNILSVDHPDSRWSYDCCEEFFADYCLYFGRAMLDLRASSLALHVQIHPRETFASVRASDRSSIESASYVFERHASGCKLPPVATKEKKPVVFIGHGRSPLWRDLKDHLQDKHGVVVTAYETGARAGHSIRDVLEQLVDESSFALLVMTAEDEQADGALRARQNVVHEAGLFQGRLGFSRAIMIVEDGVEDFSNLHGIQQIRFNRGNIRETFGEVLATLRREFPDEG